MSDWRGMSPGDLRTVAKAWFDGRTYDAGWPERAARTLR